MGYPICNNSRLGVVGSCFLFLVLLEGCRERILQGEAEITKVGTGKLNDSNSNIFSVKSIPGLRELYNDSGSINFTDKGSFWLLNFRVGKIYFEFNPSCEYGFPARLDSNRIVFFWDDDKNCNFERGLHSGFSGVRSPIIGEPFGEVYRLDDSTLYIKYLYSDWIRRINDQERKSIDTLFPAVFRRTVW